MTSSASDQVESVVLEGWTRDKLGQIAEQPQYGYTASAKLSGDGPKFLRITDIQNGQVDWDTVPVCTIGPEELQRFALAPGDIVFARTGATTGKSFLIQTCPPSSVFASYLIRLRLRPGVEPAFLSLFFNTQDYWRFISGSVTGIAQPNCNANKLSDLPVPVPPLAEQKRIVEKVEQLLAQVNAARERLARVPLILKRFRQAVLAAACSGRLTADWRDEVGLIEPASELLERIRSERQSALGWARRNSERELPHGIDDEREFPNSWMLVAINQLLHYSRPAGYGVLQPGENIPGGTPFVRVCDIVNGTVLVHQLKRIDPKIDKQYARTRLRGDEVLVTLVGTIGRTALVPPQAVGANVARAVAMLPFCPHVLPRFVQLALAEPSKNAELWGLAREVARKTLNLGLLKGVRIALPPLEEQKEIVFRVAALFKLADAIEKRVAAATARAEKLTQAILARAFRGELVPTEAELARREGRSYEPASALLDRIRAEGESASSRKSGPSRLAATSLRGEKTTKRTRRIQRSN